MTRPMPAARAALATAASTREPAIAPAVLDEDQFGAQPVGPVADQSSSSVLELWVQWDVAVVVQFADGDPEPERGADLHDGVDGEVEQFALADPGAGEQLDDQPDSGSGSARAARISLVAAASSRNRGSGLSVIGRSPVKISGRWPARRGSPIR